MILCGVQIFLGFRFGVMHTDFGTLHKNEAPVRFWVNFILISLFFALLVFVFLGSPGE
jgi:hypothetical protein